MKKIVATLLLVVVLGFSVQGTASANEDQLPKVYNTYSISVNHIN
ncbi:hypothetical protein [Sporosarcina sp. USHLN248]